MKPLQDKEPFEAVELPVAGDASTGNLCSSSTESKTNPSGTDEWAPPETPPGCYRAISPDAFEGCETPSPTLISNTSSSVSVLAAALPSSGLEEGMEEFCRHALDAGRMQARRIGVPIDSVDDCALGFVAHILVEVRERKGTGFEVSRPWLLRCAANWARNERRGQRRRRWRERLSADLCPDNGGMSLCARESLLERFAVADDGNRANIGSAESEADIFVLRQELVTIVRMAIALLPPGQHALWAQFYVEEQSIADIALLSGKKPNAVRQSLWALRQRIRALLQGVGLDEAEAAEYLALLRSQQQGTGP